MSGLRVLVVDDAATARLVLESAVSTLGHECLTACDGVEALEAIERWSPDVVITDWLMPRMDGDELCRRIRERTDGPYTYVMLLTSFVDREHAVSGMLAGADDFLTKPLDQQELHTRMIAAERVTALHRRLAAQQTALEALARRDALTGVGNRLALNEALAVAGSHLRRHARPFCVVLFDVDRFKLYNDSAGHLAGDAALRAVAQRLASESRGTDSVYRYGGEELAVLLADEELDAGVIAAERLRAAVEALGIAHPGVGGDAVVTLSGGVAMASGVDQDDPEALLRRADRALYEAKESGRNRVVAAPATVIAA